MRTNVRYCASSIFSPSFYHHSVNVTKILCNHERKNSCEHRINHTWNSTALQWYIQYHFVSTMHESTAAVSHLAQEVSSGFLSIRLSTDEVVRWSESFDHLLSHKCKWTFSIFQGEQSLLHKSRAVSIEKINATFI